MEKPLLDIRDLNVDFRTPRGRVHALRNVSFAVPRGKSVGVVGESGSGKSTVIWAVTQLLARNAVVESGVTIPYPALTENFHYEAELIVVIGKGGRDIPEAQSLDHIWGYAVGNDLTRRDLQLEAREKGRPWDWGKAFDRSAVIGPVHPVSAIGHPDRGAITLTLNGETKQRGDLNELIWSVPEIVSILSHSMEITPGDLIMTGTPAGVGPMVAGDTCVVAIEGLGTIETKIGPRV